MFIGIELPDAARAHLIAVRRQLEPSLPKVAWTRDENLHLTLKFLGTVEPRQEGELVESLGNIQAGGEIRLHSKQIVCFPDRGPVRIIAAELDGSTAALRAVHGAIEQRCKFLGFNREGRAYRPHVTLARARTPLPAANRADAPASVASDFPGPGFPIAEFVLFESRLHPQGSQYIPRWRFSL
jgi:2'-5' RNA ligase